MHASVVLIDFSSVGFRGEPCESFFEDINSEWFVRSDEDVDSEIEFMSINEQRVGYVPRNHTQIIDIHIVHVVNQVDSLALRSIRRFHDPDVLFRVVLPQFLVVSVEFSELVRQDIGVRDEIEGRFSVFFLHSYSIAAKPIFPSDFMRLREMVDLLVFIQTLVNVLLAGTCAPH